MDRMMKSIWIFLLILMPSVGFGKQIWPIEPWLGIYIIVTDGETPCTVDFEDFIAFARAFNSVAGDPNFNIRADTNQDGVVGWVDFVAFAGTFGATRPGLIKDCVRHKVVVSGEVRIKGKPFENVWIDVLEIEDAKVTESTKTDALGVFKHVGLARGDYALVPKLLGYTFSPDTLQISVEDSAFSVLTIQSAMAFGVVNVKVLRDGLPVSDAVVSFSQSVSGQKSKGSWEGTTDPSGVTLVHIPVLEGQSSISGMYVVQVKNTETGEILDSWTSVPIQTRDTRRLVLDIGHEAYYIPEREYFFYSQDNIKMPITASEERLRIWFREDVDEQAKEAMLDQLGLEDDGDHFFSLTHARGRLVVLETMHHLKMSSFIESVTPELDAGPVWNHNSNRLIIEFKDGTTEAEKVQFLKSLGGAVVGGSQEGLDVVEVFDLLSQDIFEVSERYREHPLVKYTRPDFRALQYIWLLQPD